MTEIQANQTALRARLAAAAALAGDVPAAIMFMPGGVQTITAWKGDAPHTITLTVDRETARTLEAIRASIARTRKKAFFDFNHAEGEASGYPTEFFWSESPEPGVYARVSWSEAGATAIRGRSFRAFSPAFVPDDYDGTPEQPARVVAAPVCMGGLVNDEAFTNNLPLWAKSAASTQAATQPQTSDDMDKKELAALQAQKSQMEQELTTLRAKSASAETAAAISAKSAEVEALRARCAEGELAIVRAEKAEIEQRDLARRQADAKEAIRAAQAKGVFPAQPAADSPEAKDMAKWEQLCTNDPSYIPLLARQGAPVVTAAATAGSRANVEVTGDLNGAIRAYSAEADAMKRGILYATAIRSVIAKDDGFAHVMRAANSLGTVAPGIVTQRTLDLLTIAFPQLSRISTDFSNDGAAYGEAVTTRLVTPPAIGTYHTTNGYVSDNATTTDVPVTLNQHKFVQLTFNANEVAGTRRMLFSEQDSAMHYTLGKDLVDVLYALFTTTNYTETPTTVAAIDFGRASVVDIGTAMQSGGRNANTGTRTLLLSSEYYGQLAKDTTVVGGLVNPNAGGAIASGIIPNVHGFMAVDAPNLPTTGNLTGVGLRADAVAMAVRPAGDYASAIDGLPSTGIVQQITNPDTGLSVTLTAFVDHQKGFTSMRLAWIYGVEKGNIKSAQLVRSQA